MNISLKKIVALSTAVGLVAMHAVYLTVNAAGVTTILANGATTLAANAQITTVTFTPTTALTAGSSFVLSYDASINDAGLVAGNISVANVATDLTAGVAVVSTADNTITVPVTAVTTGTSPVTLTFVAAHFAAPASGNITLGVTTSVGGVAAEMIYVANANVVQVTAHVAPILTMAITNNNSASFGTLVPGTPKQAGTAATPDTPTTTNLAIATNATTGYNLATTATTMTDASNGNTLVNATAAKNISAVEGYGINVATAVGTTVAANYDATAAEAATKVSPATAATLASRINPTAGDSLDVAYWMNTTTVTKAGNYAGSVTYTLTGNF